MNVEFSDNERQWISNAYLKIMTRDAFTEFDIDVDADTGRVVKFDVERSYRDFDDCYERDFDDYYDFDDRYDYYDDDWYDFDDRYDHDFDDWYDFD